MLSTWAHQDAASILSGPARLHAPEIRALEPTLDPFSGLRPRTLSPDPALDPSPGPRPGVPLPIPSSGMLPAMLQNRAALPTPPTGLWLHPKGGGRSSEDTRCRIRAGTLEPGNWQRVYPPSSCASYRACPTLGSVPYSPSPTSCGFRKG